MSPRVRLAASLAALLLASRAFGGDEPRSIAFIGARVITMDGELVLPEGTVVVRGDEIAAVGLPDEVLIPAGARRIDATGLSLLPGLIDAHVHIADRADLLLDLAHGVTSVRNLMGLPHHLELREAVRSGELLGPRIFTSGPFVNLPQVRTPADAERAVVEQAAAGYDCIKIHGDLSPETFRALAAAARAAEMPLVGHVPRNLDLLDVLEQGGLREISHAEELLYTYFQRPGRGLDLALVPALGRELASRGIALTATLTAYDCIVRQVADLDAVLARPEVELVPPLARSVWSAPHNRYRRTFSTGDVAGLERNLAFLKELVRGLAGAGVTILAGTDAMNPSVVPGAALHDELALLAAAGLSPHAVLRAATADAGELLAPGSGLGTVCAGAPADLLLVRGDPLADIGAAARIAGVMTRGRWLSRSELDIRLSALVASYRAEEAFAARIGSEGLEPAIDDLLARRATDPEAFACRADTLVYAHMLYERTGKPEPAREALELLLDEYPECSFDWARRALEAPPDGVEHR